ncbi:MAG: hypothetical protein RNU03_11910 [Candidatus Sedimenticola sp. (ex Thyasira tokunagai)]
MTNKHGDGDVEIGGINVGAGTVTLVSNESAIGFGSYYSQRGWIRPQTTGNTTLTAPLPPVEALHLSIAPAAISVTNNTMMRHSDVTVTNLSLNTDNDNAYVVSTGAVNFSAASSVGTGTIDLTVDLKAM